MESSFKKGDRVQFTRTYRELARWRGRLPFDGAREHMKEFKGRVATVEGPDPDFPELVKVFWLPEPKQLEKINQERRAKGWENWEGLTYSYEPEDLEHVDPTRTAWRI